MMPPHRAVAVPAMTIVVPIVPAAMHVSIVAVAHIALVLTIPITGAALVLRIRSIALVLGVRGRRCKGRAGQHSSQQQHLARNHNHSPNVIAPAAPCVDCAGATVNVSVGTSANAQVRAQLLRGGAMRLQLERTLVKRHPANRRGPRKGGARPFQAPRRSAAMADPCENWGRPHTEWARLRFPLRCAD